MRPSLIGTLALLSLGTTGACAHDDEGMEQELSRLRREVHALRRSVEENKVSVERVEQQVDMLEARAQRSPASPQKASGARAKAPSTPSLPVVRLSADGQSLDLDAGAIDDGSPPILIKMGPDPSPKIRVNEQVLRQPDPVLDGQAEKDPKGAYEEALATLRERGDAARALGLFLAFEQAHPDSSYADNAAYWAGEARIQLEDWEGATESFRRVLNVYPRSSKRPYALLRLGQSLRARGQRDEGDQRLREVVDGYPGTEPAEEARALLEGAEERNL